MAAAPCPPDANFDGKRNLQKSNVERSGRGWGKVVEPSRPLVSRTYAVAWRKKSLDNVELARLRYQEGLKIRDVASRLGVGRTTVVNALKRLESAEKGGVS